MNLTKQFADNLDFLTVKMPLNEDIVSNDIGFFSEMIDSIMTNGANRGMYGGRTGEIYQKFRDVLDSVDFEARYDIPLGFGSAYVGAQMQDTQETVTQRVLKEDLKELHQEASEAGMSTIVILLDECDLLAENTALLQKLRNIFTDIDGYILVLSGTEDMFPDLSDTFSPLPRSFVNIQVDDFEDIEKTEECIKKPLSSDRREQIERDTVAQIHRITGGSPYEINLISHHMYRRCLQQNDEKIQLSKPVLDDVLEELEGIRQEGHHEIANKIGGLSPSQLQILTSTLEFPNTEPEQFLKYNLLDNIGKLGRQSPSSVEEEIHSQLNELIELDVVDNSDEKISFAGSQFDSLYLRYYVASMDTPGNDISFFQGNEGHLVSNIFSKFAESIFTNNDRIWAYSDQPSRFDVESQSETSQEHRLFINFQTVPFESTHNTLEDLIFDQPRGPYTEELQNVFSFRCEIEWLDGGFTAIIPQCDEQTREKIDEIANTLESAGFKIQLESDYQYVIEGEECKDNGNYEEAIKYYNKAIDINSRNRLSNLRKAEVEHDRGNSENALELLDELCNEEPDWISPFVIKGLIQLDLGDKEGYENIKQALPDPQNSLSAFERAIQGLNEIGRYEKSKEIANKLVNSDDIRPNQKLNFAKVLIDSGHPSMAIKIYEKISISDLPEGISANYYYNRACAHSLIDNKEEAIESLKEAVEIDDRYLESASSDGDLDNIRDNEQFEQIMQKSE
ncbi:tetratricopeptide repeat protein [Haloarcula sp. CGMCC 1.6347]|uniref:tetratricopeptide repeat protein n=1 Tax=Haloarcula sp. CGMCC 1.6347 TaxID=3111455 RepID=UPI00300F73F2